MYELIGFVTRYRLLTILLVFSTIFPSVLLAKRIGLFMRKHLVDTLAGRHKTLSVYHRCVKLVNGAIKDYERRSKKAGIYQKTLMKLKKAGYSNEYAAVVYLFLKYVLSSIVFIVALVFNYPDVVRPVVLVILIIVIIELVIGAEKRKINLKFQKYIYKIYKYLHNQISSGVKATDAIKTVYEVVDDSQLKNVLIRLAARYELTLDIDNALGDFRANFDIQEVETLCVALKQGVETGDNQELLARQEDVMFKKYFNFIQAETDGCKTRSLLAVAMFTAIVVIMIVVPLFNDMSAAVSKIFIN